MKSNGIDEVDNPVAHQSGFQYQAATKVEGTIIN